MFVEKFYDVELRLDEKGTSFESLVNSQEVKSNRFKPFICDGDYVK
jgi:hypothetical protein